MSTTQTGKLANGHHTQEEGLSPAFCEMQLKPEWRKDSQDQGGVPSAKHPGRPRGKTIPAAQRVRSMHNPDTASRTFPHLKTAWRQSSVHHRISLTHVYFHLT